MIVIPYNKVIWDLSIYLTRYIIYVRSKIDRGKRILIIEYLLSYNEGGVFMDIRILKYYLWLCLHWKEEPTFEGLKSYKNSIS